MTGYLEAWNAGWKRRHIATRFFSFLGDEERNCCVAWHGKSFAGCNLIRYHPIYPAIGHSTSWHKANQMLSDKKLPSFNLIRSNIASFCHRRPRNMLESGFIQHLYLDPWTLISLHRPCIYSSISRPCGTRTVNFLISPEQLTYYPTL